MGDGVGVVRVILLEVLTPEALAKSVIRLILGAITRSPSVRPEKCKMKVLTGI